MLADVERHLSPATRVFTSDSFSPVLEEILLDLPLKDVLRAALVSKHVNQVIADSAHIQLALRVILHQLPISETQPVGNHEWASYGATLRRLLEREHRLSTWTPKEIRCLHLPHSRVVDVQDGYILFEEHTSRERIFDDAPPDDKHYKTDGWTVWKLTGDGSVTQSEATLRGKKHQGLPKWRGSLSQEGGRVHALAFCPQDDVIAVARRFGPVHSDRLNTKVFVNRFFFYAMRADPSHPDKLEAHQEAALPFIELLTEDLEESLSQFRMISMQIIPEGRMLATINGVRDLGQRSCTVWDWKQGCCLGRMDPWDPCDTMFMSLFLTPDWVLCGTRRTVHINRDKERHYDLGFAEGEYGRLMGFDVFAVNHKPHKYFRPVGIGHGNDVFSIPCSWAIWNVKPARRLCILYLPPLRPSYEDWAFDNDFEPIAFDMACPVTTRFRRHLPEVLTFTVMGICRFGPNDEYLQVMQGVLPVRVILAAALCGSMRNFALDESMHRNRSSPEGVGDADGELSSTSSAYERAVETPKSRWDEGLDTSAEDFRASMHTADDQPEQHQEESRLGETHSSTPRSELSNYLNGTSSFGGLSAPPIMIPWSILRKFCDLSSICKKYVASSYGRRVLSVLDLPGQSINVVEINDYSSLALPATRLLRKHIAALHSTGLGTVPVGTVTRRCPLPKPFKLPQLGAEKSLRAASDPRWVVEPRLLAQGSVQCDIPYLSRQTSMSVDAARPVETAHFDGDRIILTTRNGANILSF